jgi:threonine dehydrogenase-like Zn-dependent dehydrogenase
MPSNRGVVYLKPVMVEVQKIDFPTFRNLPGKPIDHGVILKVTTTNIRGSDQHMVRGRATAPPGMVLGYEITGEMIERGRDVEYLEREGLVTLRQGPPPRRRSPTPGIWHNTQSDLCGGRKRERIFAIRSQVTEGCVVHYAMKRRLV